LGTSGMEFVVGPGGIQKYHLENIKLKRCDYKYNTAFSVDNGFEVWRYTFY
jgi:hypothetical protein